MKYGLLRRLLRIRFVDKGILKAFRVLYVIRHASTTFDFITLHSVIPLTLSTLSA